MKKLTTNLDERQENLLLHIEKNGCWIAFWVLIASIFLQQTFGIRDIKSLAGEYISFLSLAIYLAIGCIKNGIWDRHLKADSKTNLLTSIIAATLASTAFILVNYSRFKNTSLILTIFAVIFLCVLIVCFLTLSVLLLIYKKKIEILENEYEESL